MNDYLGKLNETTKKEISQGDGSGSVTLRGKRKSSFVGVKLCFLFASTEERQEKSENNTTRKKKKHKKQGK